MVCLLQPTNTNRERETDTKKMKIWWNSQFNYSGNLEVLCIKSPKKFHKILAHKIHRAPTEFFRGGTPILGHIRDVRPEWVTFPGQKPADGCKFLTKNLRMGHNFDIILPGNGWFSRVAGGGGALRSFSYGYVPTWCSNPTLSKIFLDTKILSCLKY